MPVDSIAAMRPCEYDCSVGVPVSKTRPLRGCFGLREDGSSRRSYAGPDFASGYDRIALHAPTGQQVERSTNLALSRCHLIQEFRKAT